MLLMSGKQRIVLQQFLLNSLAVESINIEFTGRFIGELLMVLKLNGYFL